MPWRDEGLGERFWSKVDKNSGGGPEGDCWPWTGYLDSRGRGTFRFGKNDPPLRLYSHPGILPTRHGERISVVKVAYVLAHGPLGRPDDISSVFVDQRCLYAPCCNPDHLFVTTLAEHQRYRAGYPKW